MSDLRGWGSEAPLDFAIPEGPEGPAREPSAPSAPPAAPLDFPDFSLDEQSPEAHPHGLRLEIQAGPAAGLQHTVQASGSLVGRDTTSDLQVLDPRVSRQHLRIERHGDTWFAVDLGSRNGTRVNGVEITRIAIAPGDFIYLGDSVIRVAAG